MPLRKDNSLLGYIVIYRQHVQAFSDKQIALLQNFAAQAVIAMENARLITETREALERQTATAEILRVISSSPTDVQPTFDAIAEAAATLSGAAGAGVYRYDGSLIHFVAHRGWTADELDAARGVYPIPPGRGSLTARAITTREVAHVADIAADPEFPQPSFVQAGFHTVLSVPMLRDGDPIGAITVTRHQVELFTDKQIELLKTFAAQAVIAIENVAAVQRADRAHRRPPGVARIPDRDQRRAEGHQPLDLRPAAGARYAVSKPPRGCAARIRRTSSNREGEVYRTAATFAYAPEFDAIRADSDRFRPVAGLSSDASCWSDRSSTSTMLAADPEYTVPGSSSRKALAPDSAYRCCAKASRSA